jgi:hypothetical protein
MSNFVAKNLETPCLIPALYLKELRTLQALEARMSQVEWYGDSWDSIRREPLVREPIVRSKSEIASLKFCLHLCDSPLKRRCRNREVQITHANLHQFIIREVYPPEPLS